MASVKKDMDMLHGPMWKNILLFALPMAASSIMQQLFHSVDMAVVGRFCGPNELAAVGSNSSIINLLVNMFLGFSAGANVVIGQLIGAGKLKTAKKAVGTSLVIALVSGIIVMILGVLLSSRLLKLISSPPDVINLASTYLKIYFSGIPFLMVYNFTVSILRSRGETTKPFFCLVIGGVVNVILNLILVIVFHQGVVGVGVATVVSNIISCFLILRILTTDKSPLGIKIKEIKFDKFIFSRIFKMGFPMTIQSCLFPLSNMLIQSSVNSLGTLYVAGNAAACSIEAFNYSLEGAFAMATMSFVSQNYGAKNLGRCKKAVREFISIGLLVICFFACVMYFMMPVLLSMFTTDHRVVAIATTRLTVLYISLPLALLMDGMTYSIRGLGYSIIPTIVSVVGVCGFRILWIYTVFKSVGTYFSILLVYPISWIIVFSILFVCYRVLLRKIAKNFNN